MQRWFFAGDQVPCSKPEPEVVSVVSSEHHSPVPSITLSEWRFCVLVRRKLMPNEFVAVIGDCEQLGNWQFPNCLILTPDEENNRKWTVNVVLPDNRKIAYRYLIAAVDATSKSVIARFWETHRVTRKVPINRKKCCDKFGWHKRREHVSRGWLTKETIVQFKFYNSQFIWKQQAAEGVVHIRVTPLNLRIHSSVYVKALEDMSPPPSGMDLEEFEASKSGAEVALMSEATDSSKLIDEDQRSTAFAFNEVAILCADGGNCLCYQPEFGTACGADDLVLFQMTVGDFEGTAYMLQFYCYEPKAAADVPPRYIGYQYVLPKMFKCDTGQVNATILCATTHRALVDVKFSYLIVRPMPVPPLDMSVSYARHWKNRLPLDIGHRGCGKSFMLKDCLHVENTICSLKKAARNGADMVEFDVQLTKDLIPVLYHDFYIKDLPLTLARKQPCLYDFTLTELRRFLCSSAMAHFRKMVFANCKDCEMLEECLPFPPLAEVFESLNPHIGFNIEIKWPQRYINCVKEADFARVFNPNNYIDRVLEVVMEKAGSRRIVFSCFDADICAMLRYKQNRWPVMLILQGSEDQMYMNPIVQTYQSAIYFSKTIELLGIVMKVTDLLSTSNIFQMLKQYAQVIFCYGDEITDKNFILKLMNTDVNGIIYDRMDLLNNKHSKISVFQKEADIKERKQQRKLNPNLPHLCP